MNKLIFILFATAISATALAAGTTNKNGFDLSDSLIPVSEIHQGGPPRDGIPSINSPEYLQISQVDYLKDDDLVLGLELNGIARAYPIRILIWHEIVNTEFEQDPVVITFCPLCGTGIAFLSQAIAPAEKEKGEQVIDFGVSGLLHNNDMLMYDRQTDSLWSQIPGTAVSGPMAGARLKRLSVTHIPWTQWKHEHPKGEVLSTQTGALRDYDDDPYKGYDKTEKLFFPISKTDKRYTNKEMVLGLEKDGKAKVWPFSELNKSAVKTGTTTINDTFLGKPVEIVFDPKSKTATIKNSAGEQLPAIRAFWFAWYGFYPDTEVYKFR
ncbi:MAG: DUF3179 domain-containing protein [Pseudomonadales bacterium]|nr:DUF3179 domain-containing protein [Pseudomonadales bacterium]